MSRFRIPGFSSEGSSRGFSLIELVIVVGVGGMATYFITTWMVSSEKNATSINSKGEFNSFVNELQTVFNNTGSISSGGTSRSSIGSCLAAFQAPNSIVPSLSGMGLPGAQTTVPVPIALNTGNSDPTKGALTKPYAAGTQWGKNLTIMQFQIMGLTPQPSTQVSAANNHKFIMPIYLLVSRRVGLLTGQPTPTSTGTSTDSSTGSSTASLIGTATLSNTGTGTSTATSTSSGTAITTASGSTAAIGGDLLAHTFNLLVTLAPDANGNPNGRVVGCSGQAESFWRASVSTATSTATSSGSSTGTGTATSTSMYGSAVSLSIKFTNSSDGQSGGVGIAGPGTNFVPFPNATNPMSTSTNASVATSTFAQIAVRLDVDGAVQGASFQYRSDERLKENVREIPRSMDRVSQLHGVIYDWKNPPVEENQRDQLGFLAQDVEKVFPEAVVTNSASGIKAVAYENLVAPLIEALKDRQRVIVQQEREIAELKRLLSKGE